MTTTNICDIDDAVIVEKQDIVGEFFYLSTFLSSLCVYMRIYGKYDTLFCK